jgi:predicted AlkP superfamily pyrophosphatase or phosphodiesterase
LGFDALKHNNALTPIMISSQKTHLFPTTKNPAAITHFLHHLDAIALEEVKNSLENLSKTLHKKIKKKSLIILVGDFLGEVDLALLAQRHELYVIMIRDSFEENPTTLGDGEFLDPESAEKADFYFGKKAKEAYAKAYHDNDEKLFKHLHTIGAHYTKVVI